MLGPAESRVPVRLPKVRHHDVALDRGDAIGNGGRRGLDFLKLADRGRREELVAVGQSERRSALYVWRPRAEQWIQLARPSGSKCALEKPVERLVILGRRSLHGNPAKRPMEAIGLSRVF